MRLTWFSGNRWGCLIDPPPFLLLSSPLTPFSFHFILVEYRSLRNHNKSLVAASPTRHPGPLQHCGAQTRRRMKQQQDVKAMFPPPPLLVLGTIVLLSGTPVRRHVWQGVRFHSSDLLLAVSVAHRAAAAVAANN